MEMDTRSKLETTVAGYEKMSGWKPSSYVFIVLGFLVAVASAFDPFYLIPGIVILVLGFAMLAIFLHIDTTLPTFKRQLKELEAQSNASIINQASAPLMATVTPAQASLHPANPGVKYCKHCGQQIAVDSAFCEKCGTKLV